MIWLVVGLAIYCGGLGGYLLYTAWKTAENSSPPTRRHAPDELAELQRLIGTYRAEVTDLQDLVERRYRRDVKREERSTGISTGNPQGERDRLRAWFAEAKVRRRGGA